MAVPYERISTELASSIAISATRNFRQTTLSVLQETEQEMKELSAKRESLLEDLRKMDAALDVFDNPTPPAQQEGGRIHNLAEAADKAGRARLEAMSRAETDETDEAEEIEADEAESIETEPEPVEV